MRRRRMPARAAPVDHSLLLIDKNDTLDRAGVYVPLTRGRESNRVLAVSGPEASPTYLQDFLTEAIERRWVDTPAVSKLETEDPKAQLAEVEAVIEHMSGRMESARTNNRHRPHSLHQARAKRLIRHYEAACRVRHKLDQVIAAGVTLVARRPAVEVKPPVASDSDIGMDF